MIEFIKTDRFLLLVVILALLSIYAYRMDPAILELLKLSIAGFIGLLRGSGSTQQFILPESGKMTTTGTENIVSLAKKLENQ